MSINVFCRYCGQTISDTDLVCKHCHSKQNFTVSTRGLPRNNSEGVLAFIVCVLFGFLGLHRFLYGKTGTGVLMLITLGGFGIWWVIDIIRIAIGHFTDSAGHRLSLLHDH